MIRIIFWFAVLAAVTFGATWLADRPGSISIEWLGYRIENLSVGVALLAIAALFITIWLAWSIFKWVLGRPGAFGGYFARRRERIGREALSKGLIAVGAGDEKSALQYARTASKKLPGDPLAKLLEAQSALYQGDSARVTSVYREMTQTPQTRLLGLRGLFNEARKAKNIEAARGYAKQALKENPGTVWASNAMAAACSAEGDWPCVLEILENQKKAGTLDPDEFKRKKAVVLAAQALSLEDRDLEAATDLAVSAHRLDPSLVPAAVVAGRTLSALGSLRKASRILEKTWKLSPHPDIAEVYIHARPGDSVTDRLKRAKDLVRVYHGKEEGALALAKAAIEAGEWKTAREALNPYIHDRPRARVCMVMAQLENAEFGDKGRAREWLARAVRAPRDPAWTADGIVSAKWLPVSPVSGQLGVFEWKIPVEGLGYTEPGKDEHIISVLAASDDEMAKAEAKAIPAIEDHGTEEQDVAPEESDEAPAPEPGDEKEPGKAKKETAPEAAKPAVTPGAVKPEPPQEEEKDDAGQEATMLHQPDDPGPKKTNGAKSKSNWFS